MRVAVTGASGFVGGAILAGLRERGHEVIGLSRRGPDIHWDIAAGVLLAPPPVDTVVHCAALVRDGCAGPLHWAVNVVGTENVLRSFARAQIIHMSSASVYDPSVPKVLVREDAPAPQRWLNGYGETKRAAENVVLRLRPDAIVLRPHAVYGRGDTTLLPRLLRARLAGRQLAVGDGRNRITLTSIHNLVDAVYLALHRPNASGPLNIGDGETPTVAEVLSHLLHCLDLPPAITWIPRPAAWPAAILCERLAASREPPLSRYSVNAMSLDFTLDLGRARRELGWEPQASYRSAFVALGAAHMIPDSGGAG